MLDDENEQDIFEPLSEAEERALDIKQGAWDLYLNSTDDANSEPMLSPEKAFTLAEEFYAEAQRRGY